MTQRIHKAIETPAGRGQVFKNDQWIADVQYNLHVNQEYLIIKTLSNQSEIPGSKNIAGQIQVLNGERDLISSQENLTLHLADGRKWRFFASRGNIMTGVYTVQNSSGDGL